MRGIGRPSVLLAALAVMPFGIALQYPDCISGPLSNNTVCDSAAEPSRRAAALVAAMTIDEKLAQLVDRSPGASRIGLPAYEWWSEALHGVASSPGVRFAQSGEYSSATSFPNPILLSAAFDDDLVEAVADVIGTEARSFANGGRAGLDFWTPNINPFRDPRWGRGMETPGEDSFRIEGYVKHLLRGLEGTEKTRKVISTCKHFAAYDLEDWNGTDRYHFDAKVSLQDLSEYYLSPFKQCARDSNVGSIMCSYNAVNGIPACASLYLMQTILREHWGWQKDKNYIVSDCNAVHNIFHDHKYVQTAAQAVGTALNAGMDNVCEAGNQPTDQSGAFNQSLVTEATIDQALRRQYEGLVRVGYFDSPNSTYRDLSWNAVNTEHARELALQAATDGMVLLKNDGTLPLKIGDNTTVALIGFWANATSQLLGGYSGIPPYYHGPLAAAQGRGIKFNYANGPISQALNSSDYLAQALAAARNSDIVLYFGGIDTSVEREERDRTTISLPDAQQAIIRTICNLGKPCAVVRLGTQVDDTPLLENPNVNAILWAGYPGQDGGTAVFDILTGTKAPAGRLPVTQYPSNYTDQVPMTDMSLRPTNGSNPGRTYKWYDNAVLPFGHGLHYTNFTISPLTNTTSTLFKRNTRVHHISRLVTNCTTPHLDLCPFPAYPIRVQNNGNVTSDFVALAFVSSAHAGPAPQPIKQLAAYKRVRDIKPGETRTTSLDLTLGSFARTDEKGNLVLYAGAYCVLLDVPTKSRECFGVLGDDMVLDAFPQPNETSVVNVTRRFEGARKGRMPVQLRG